MRAKHQRSIRAAGRVPAAPAAAQPAPVEAAVDAQPTDDPSAGRAAAGGGTADDLPPRRRARRRAVRPGVGGDPVIAGVSADDTDVGWHENAGTSADDERLRRDVPPHW